MKRRTRRRLRTAVLGVVACAALFWGAVDLVGVPVANLLRVLMHVTVGVGMVILAAAVPGVLLSRRRRRRDTQ